MTIIESAPPVAVEGSYTFALRSKEVGEAFQIDVRLPWSYGASGGRTYPVVYLTDSTDFFPTVSGNIHLMQLSGDIPEVILVGIGYPAGSPVLSLRTRDLTPTLDFNYAEEARADPHFPLVDGIDPGGAERCQYSKSEDIATERRKADLSCLKPVSSQRLP